jgi:hypothetical protein
VGTSAALRLRWLLAVLATILVLTAGWPLISTTVAGLRPLIAGATVTVGPSATSSGRITVGPGWSVLTSSTNPHEYYSFGRGAVRLLVRYVRLTRAGDRRQLWQGMRQMLRVGYPGLTPGRPRPIIVADGSRGLIAHLSGPGRSGKAAVVAAPAAPFAIEIVMVGPSSASAVLVAVGLPVLRSLRFPAATR